MDGDYDMISDDAIKKNRDRFLELENEFIMKYNNMEWISVNDRLPSEKDECIIYFTNNRGRFVTGNAFWNGNWFETIGGLRDEPAPYFDTEIVTHWMPLPKPPKT